MRIMVQNEHLNLTIYQTNKVRIIGTVLYFVCEVNSESAGKRYLMPLKISFPAVTQARDVFKELYDHNKVDLSDRVAVPIATLKELRVMSNKELAHYFKKFVN